MPPLVCRYEESFLLMTALLMTVGFGFLILTPKDYGDEIEYVCAAVSATDWRSSHLPTHKATPSVLVNHHGLAATAAATLPANLIQRSFGHTHA